MNKLVYFRENNQSCTDRNASLIVQELHLRDFDIKEFKKIVLDAEAQGAKRVKFDEYDSNPRVSFYKPLSEIEVLEIQKKDIEEKINELKKISLIND